MNYSLKSDIRYSGFIAGFTGAFIGSALFAIIDGVFRLAIIAEPTSRYFSALEILLFSIIYILPFGCMFSALPAGIGGFVLGLLLKAQMHKESLTLKKATKTGILLAGLVAIIICGFGILFLMLYPHNNWHIFSEDVKQGTFFANYYNYLRYDIKLIIRFIPEILTAILIACVAGGWTGRVLAKQLLSTSGHHHE